MAPVGAIAHEARRRAEVTAGWNAAPDHPALAAYRQAVADMNADLFDAYWAHFTDPLAWYGRSDVTREAARTARGNPQRTYVIDALGVLTDDGDEVAIVDVATLQGPPDCRPATKLLTLRREGGAWRISGEGSIGRNQGLAGLEAPSLLATPARTVIDTATAPEWTFAAPASTDARSHAAASTLSNRCPMPAPRDWRLPTRDELARLSDLAERGAFGAPWVRTCVGDCITFAPNAGVSLGRGADGAIERVPWRGGSTPDGAPSLVWYVRSLWG